MFSGKGGWIPNSAPQFISLSIIWHHRIHTPQPLGQVSIPEAGTLWRQTPSWSLTKSRILKRASQHFRVLKGCNLQEVFQSNPLCITIYLHIYISIHPVFPSPCGWCRLLGAPNLRQSHKGHIYLRCICEGLRQELPQPIMAGFGQGEPLLSWTRYQFASLNHMNLYFPKYIQN